MANEIFFRIPHGYPLCNTANVTDTESVNKGENLEKNPNINNILSCNARFVPCSVIYSQYFGKLSTSYSLKKDKYDLGYISSSMTKIYSVNNSRSFCVYVDVIFPDDSLENLPHFFSQYIFAIKWENTDLEVEIFQM